MKNNGTHCLHSELNPIQNPGQQTTDKHHLEGINKIQQRHKSTIYYHKPTSHTSTSSEHCFTPQSNAHEPQRLFTFHEVVSKSCTRIHRHCHHQYFNTTPDTCTRPPADAVLDRIRTTP